MLPPRAPSDTVPAFWEHRRGIVLFPLFHTSPLATTRHLVKVQRYTSLPNIWSSKTLRKTTDGWNLVKSPVDMVNIPLFTTGFIYPRWCRISSINRMTMQRATSFNQMPGPCYFRAFLWQQKSKLKGLYLIGFRKGKDPPEEEGNNWE